jgi:hypothetical protein
MKLNFFYFSQLKHKKGWKFKFWFPATPPPTKTQSRMKLNNFPQRKHLKWNLWLICKCNKLISFHFPVSRFHRLALLVEFVAKQVPRQTSRPNLERRRIWYCATCLGLSHISGRGEAINEISEMAEWRLSGERSRECRPTVACVTEFIAPLLGVLRRETSASTSELPKDPYPLLYLQNL